MQMLLELKEQFHASLQQQQASPPPTPPSPFSLLEIYSLSEDLKS